MKKYFGQSNELCNVGALVVINASKKHEVCNLLPEYSKNAKGEIDNLQTLAEIMKVGFALVSNDNKLVNYFKAFNDFGVYCPKSARESYINCVRRNDNQAIMICTSISNKTYNEEGKEGYYYTFEEAFVSSVPLKETALAMSKKTLEALSNIKHNKGWRNAALGLLSQFEVMDIKERIQNGEEVSPELESESEDSESIIVTEGESSNNIQSVAS